MSTNHCPDNLERIQIQSIRPWPAHAARCVYLPTTRVPNSYATMVRSRLAETMVNRGDDPWNSRHIPRRVEVLLLGAREVAAEQLVRVMLVKRRRAAGRSPPSCPHIYFSLVSLGAFLSVSGQRSYHGWLPHASLHAMVGTLSRETKLNITRAMVMAALFIFVYGDRWFPQFLCLVAWDERA
jgi:hypothetical protein